MKQVQEQPAQTGDRPLLQPARPGEDDVRLVDRRAGRGRSLYGVTGHDSGMLRRLIDIPVAGMFSAGEIAPIQGATFVHGYTSVFGLLRPRTVAGT